MLGLKKSSVTRKRLCQQRGVCYSSSHAHQAATYR